jgi:cold shock protein
MAKGAIKWFHAIMGYGVIAPDDGSAGVLVRVSAADAARLGRFRTGDRLEYDVVAAPHGPPQAANVRLLAMVAE